MLDRREGIGFQWQQFWGAGIGLKAIVAGVEEEEEEEEEEEDVMGDSQLQSALHR